MKHIAFVSTVLASFTACQFSQKVPTCYALTKAQPILLAQRTPAKQVPCRFDAYIIDKDPQGLNVRSSPGSNQRVIAKIPTNTEGVIATVSACQGDWVQISQAETIGGKAVFSGKKGWVYAPLLGTSTRGYGSKGGVFVYASPSSQSRKLGKIPATTQVKLLGGNGQWAFVEYKNLKGWLAPEEQCGNPVTTCP